ncbi:MAG: hypothetical protein MUF23_05775 [Pirellula sp.]|nr:hypothetical protein [Pirellula sp.]
MSVSKLERSIQHVASNQSDSTAATAFVYLIGTDAPPFLTMYGEIEWCAFPNKSESLWVQTNFSGSPSGVASVLEFRNNISGGNQKHLKQAIGKEVFSFHTNCGYGVASRDGKSFILPIPALRSPTESMPDDSRTLVLSPDLTNIQLEWPGQFVAEYTSARCIVTCRGVQDGARFTTPEILFVSPSTGTISIVPTVASVGQFEIEIVAMADGIQIPVLKWILEIDE